jgi:hypothetical protein
MMYAAACKCLTPLERRLCQALKDDLYNDYSVLSLADGPAPVFQKDAAGNIPCVRLIGIEFSSLERCDAPRFLLIYSRSYHHIPTSPEIFTFIDVLDTLSGELRPLLKTCCISGHLVAASFDFNLKLIACVAASESLVHELALAPPSRHEANASAFPTSIDPTPSAYWLQQSTTVEPIDMNPAEKTRQLLEAEVDRLEQLPAAALSDVSPPPYDASDAEASEVSSGSLKPPPSNTSRLTVDVGDLAAGVGALSRSASSQCGVRQQFDYRTFVWSFRNAASVSSPSLPPPTPPQPHAPPPMTLDDLQLEWYDDECIFSKTCHIVPVANAAPFILRLHQEEFISIGGRIEKLRRLASAKETRDAAKLLLPCLSLEQIFVDKLPPNRVIPYSNDSVADGIIASRVLFYQWFPSEFKLLVVSVLKSAKARSAYTSAMEEATSPAFVALTACVQLFRFDAAKKGRPSLVLLVSDAISIKWPNFAMQELSRREFAEFVSVSCATPRRGSFNQGGVSTPLSPAPVTPSSAATNAAIS